MTPERRDDPNDEVQIMEGVRMVCLIVSTIFVFLACAGFTWKLAVRIWNHL